tara:strand:+ start:633 stop:824 length:192 start_codon:yes stop_codon:yes gene_type:complete
MDAFEAIKGRTVQDVGYDMEVDPDAVLQVFIRFTDGSVLRVEALTDADNYKGAFLDLDFTPKK